MQYPLGTLLGRDAESQNVVLGNDARQTGATESSLDPKYILSKKKKKKINNKKSLLFWLQKPRARNVNWLSKSMLILVPEFYSISSPSGTYTAGASRGDPGCAGSSSAECSEGRRVQVRVGAAQ